MNNFALYTENDGPEIVSSTYWGNPEEEVGKYFVSIFAGAIRVLVPSVVSRVVKDMATAKYVICSRGRWSHDQQSWDAIELLFEDGSDRPFKLLVDEQSMDIFPGEPKPGKEWVCSVWLFQDGRPHKALELPCRWRKVASLPCMLPWK